VASDGSDSALRTLSAGIQLTQRLAAELHMICLAELPHVPGSIGEVEAGRQVAQRRFAAVVDRSKKLALCGACRSNSIF
jgi:hypothetical protein